MGHCWLCFPSLNKSWSLVVCKPLEQSREGIICIQICLSWSKHLLFPSETDHVSCHGRTYAALHAWPFPLSIGFAYLHIPQFLQWSPSCRCEAVRSLISRHVPTSWAESQWWSRQRMTSSGSRRVSTAISPWYLGKSMADSRNTLHSVCNHLWSIWIYLYILCKQCGSWNFNTGARENDSASELT